MVDEQERQAEGRTYRVRGLTFTAPTLEPGLYVVATPIGNLADVTLRALDTLAAADLVACEDTRVTRRLTDRYGIDARLTPYHEHSDQRVHRGLLAALAAGKSVALVSDAGTPLLSDPGAALVADAIGAGYRVVPIPGPSSLAAVLSAAGLPTDNVLFLGFLSSKAAARQTGLQHAASIDATLVMFESPNRIGALLVDAAEILGGNRDAAVCRELTKVHESFERGMLDDLAARHRDRDVKGEVVLVVAPPNAPSPPEGEELDALLRTALAGGSVKEAARAVASATGLPRRDLYRRALELKGKS